MSVHVTGQNAFTCCLPGRSSAFYRHLHCLYSSWQTWPTGHRVGLCLNTSKKEYLLAPAMQILPLQLFDVGKTSLAMWLLQEAANEIKARSSHHLTAAVFTAWGQTAAASIEAKHRMQRVIGRMTNMRAVQVLAAWHMHAKEQRAKKAQLNKAVARLQRLRCSAVVFSWHRLTKQKQAVQGRLSKAVR